MIPMLVLLVPIIVTNAQTQTSASTAQTDGSEPVATHARRLALLDSSESPTITLASSAQHTCTKPLNVLMSALLVTPPIAKHNVLHAQPTARHAISPPPHAISASLVLTCNQDNVSINAQTDTTSQLTLPLDPFNKNAKSVTAIVPPAQDPLRHAHNVAPTSSSPVEPTLAAPHAMPQENSKNR